MIKAKWVGTEEQLLENGFEYVAYGNKFRYIGYGSDINVFIETFDTTILTISNTVYTNVDNRIIKKFCDLVNVGLIVWEEEK